MPAPAYAESATGGVMVDTQAKKKMKKCAGQLVDPKRYQRRRGQDRQVMIYAGGRRQAHPHG